MLYFSGAHKFFQISTGIKSLYKRGRKLICLQAGEAKFGTGAVTSGNLLTEEATGAHLTGALSQGVVLVNGFNECFSFAVISPNQAKYLN